jgi:mannitol-1-phosphate/altronate dehydrogenase
MNTAIPTPFDIVDPPSGPIVPSLTAWLLTALAVLGFLLASRIIQRKGRAPSMAALVVNLLEELRRAVTAPLTTTSTERIARLAKRIISPYLTQEIDSLSSSEMRELAKSLQATPRESDQSAAAILELLAKVEESAYAPTSDFAAGSNLISQLEGSLQQHVRRHPLK